MDYLLEIKDFSVSFVQYFGTLERRVITPVKHLNLNVKQGEILAIVGASGSGKSLLAHGLLGVLPSNSMVDGEIWYQGKLLTQDEIERIRGKEVRFIPQSVQYLDPTRKIGKQLEDSFDHPKRKDIERLLEEFSLSPRVYDLYPHELSGGMLRRVLFATCKGNVPNLIIADEPTPGIHPKALEEMLEQFLEFQRQGIGIIFITHDMKSAMEIGDRISIFKEGEVIGTYLPERIRELGKEVDPYTKELWLAQPINEFMEVVR